MVELKDLVNEAGVGNLSRLIESDDEKYLLFTRLTSRWVLCVSDGVGMWRMDWDGDELDAYRDLAGISTCDALLNRVNEDWSKLPDADIYGATYLHVPRRGFLLPFSSERTRATGSCDEVDLKAFQSGELDVAVLGNKVIVTAGKGMASVSFDLYEAKAVEKKAEMQTILFRLAEDVQSLNTKLSEASHTIETLKAQKGAAQPGRMLMDLGPKKGANPARSKPKKAGMSVINPTSKKRKAASGVVFD